MIQEANKVFEQLVDTLHDAAGNAAASPMQGQEHILRHIRTAIETLKNLVLLHPFADEQEEIQFFKHVKPKFTALLIYHSRLALIVLKRPIGGLEDIRLFYEKELLLIRVFYDHHIQLYQYMLAEATYLDAKLFMRGNTDLPAHYCTSAVDTDTRFSTHYDYIVARLQADKRLGEYLLQAIRDLERGYLDPDTAKPGRGMIWTGSKVYLIELAYGLYESGQINNGSTSLLEITEKLETFFQVKLGNVYRTFQEVRQRKKDSRTKFLDLMRDKLLHRMDELDGD